MTVPTFPTSTELPGITYPAVRSPVWLTDKEETLGGRRARYAHRNVPLWRWDLPFSFLRSSTTVAEWQRLVSFYNSLYGSQALFQFRDDQDHTALSQTFGSGDGVSTAFQLVRTGPTLAGTFTEYVYAPSTITSVVVAGSTLTSTQWTLTTGGVVNFAVAPTSGAGLVWSGEFAWLCRMDDDTLDLSRFMENLYELRSLKFGSELI